MPVCSGYSKLVSLESPGVLHAGEKKWRLDNATDPKQLLQLDAQWKWMARMWQLAGFLGLTAAAACTALVVKFGGGQPQPEASGIQEGWAQGSGDVPVLSASNWYISRS